MVMFAVDEVQGGLLIDHVKTVVPGVSPVIVELATREFVITPDPETFIHLPIPTPGMFPAKVVEPVLAHIVWLDPALATEGGATPVIVTFEIELAQGAFEIVHLKTLLPTPNPVMLVVGESELVIVPEPEIRVHAPIPAVGVFAAIVAPELVQTVWLGPAAAIEGIAFTVMVTFDVEEEQGGLLIDHVNTLVPTVSPVMLVVGDNELVITPEPETLNHLPIPVVAAFAFIVVDVLVAQSVLLVPAFAIVGGAIPLMITLSQVCAQGGFVIRQRKVLFPTPNPVIREVGLFGETIVPLPPIKVHCPVPAVGVLAAIVAPELTQTV